jgi:signal transduction histidine kinase
VFEYFFLPIVNNAAVLGVVRVLDTVDLQVGDPGTGFNLEKRHSKTNQKLNLKGKGMRDYHEKMLHLITTVKVSNS